MFILEIINTEQLLLLKFRIESQIQKQLNVWLGCQSYDRSTVMYL